MTKDLLLRFPKLKHHIKCHFRGPKTNRMCFWVLKMIEIKSMALGKSTDVRNNYVNTTKTFCINCNIWKKHINKHLRGRDVKKNSILIQLISFTCSEIPSSCFNSVATSKKNLKVTTSSLRQKRFQNVFNKFFSRLTSSLYWKKSLLVGGKSSQGQN